MSIICFVAEHQETFACLSPQWHAMMFHQIQPLKHHKSQWFLRRRRRWAAATRIITKIICQLQSLFVQLQQLCWFSSLSPFHFYSTWENIHLNTQLNSHTQQVRQNSILVSFRSRFLFLVSRLSLLFYFLRKIASCLIIISCFLFSWRLNYKVLPNFQVTSIWLLYFLNFSISL